MKEIKVNWTEGPDNRYVALPTYKLVEDHGDGTATVEVPDEYVAEDGSLDEAAIREIYAGQPKWDKAGVTQGVLAG